MGDDMGQVQAHCLETVNKLAQRDQWTFLDAPRCSEEELSQEVARYGLSHDPQTTRFCKFVSLATNFASLQFAERIQRVPELIGSIKNLLEEMRNEVREMADMAAIFQELVHCFINLVQTTRHNMHLMLPDLMNSKEYLDIVADALDADAKQPLSEADRGDIKVALEGMQVGIKRLLEAAQKSRGESEKLDKNIKELQSTVQNKRVVVKGRIDFGGHFKTIGQVLASFASYKAANALTVASAECLPIIPGIIKVGGRLFPSLRAVLVAAILGNVAIASIGLLVQRFWLNHNYRALEILENLFEHLIRLGEANNHFTKYMRNSEAAVNGVLVNVDTLHRQISSSSGRMRKMNQAVCKRASEATSDMISSIEQIRAIDLSQWTNTPRDPMKAVAHRATPAITYDFD